jgi:hypothetical protein
MQSTYGNIEEPLGRTNTVTLSSIPSPNHQAVSGGGLISFFSFPVFVYQADRIAMQPFEEVSRHRRVSPFSSGLLVFAPAKQWSWKRTFGFG